MGFELQKIIGLRIIAIKGSIKRKNQKKGIKPEFILFDDGKTYIALYEQDYDHYHDCSSWAREIGLIQDKEHYAQIMSGYWYADATEDIL